MADGERVRGTARLGLGSWPGGRLLLHLSIWGWMVSCLLFCLVLGLLLLSGVLDDGIEFAWGMFKLEQLNLEVLGKIGGFPQK
jgi:hypothetical protein